MTNAERRSKRKGTSKISNRRRGMQLALLKFYHMESPQSTWENLPQAGRIALARGMVKASRPQERRRNVESA